MERIINTDFTIVSETYNVSFKLLVIIVNANSTFHWTHKIKRNTNAENPLILFYSLIYVAFTTLNLEV